MGTGLCLELSLCCEGIPPRAVQDGDVGVYGLADERAGANGPVAPVYSPVLAMTLVKNEAMCYIKLLYLRQSNVINDQIKEKIKVFKAVLACIDVVQSSNARKVFYILFDFQK